MLPKLIKICFCMLIINTMSVRAIKKLTVLHMSDVHARFDETDVNSAKCSTYDKKYQRCYGGFPRVRSEVKLQRKRGEKEGRGVLFLIAGDCFQGSFYYHFFKSEIFAKLFPMLEIDALAIGHHEFDDGPESLSRFVNNVTLMFLCCNINVSAESSLSSAANFKKSMIKEIGGLKVGVVGYTSPDLKLVSNPGRNITFSNEIPCIQTEADKLRKDGAQVVIAFGHSGFEMDKRIAREVRGLDLIVGGRSNTFLHNGKQPSTEPINGPYPYMVKRKDNKNVPVVHTFSYTKYMGILDMDFDDNGKLINMSGNSLLLDKSVEQDPEFLHALEPWQDKIDEYASKEIGKTKVFLEGSSKTRKEESNLGNLITDAFVEHYLMSYLGNSLDYRNEGWTDTPIAIIQAGAIRSSINASSRNGELNYYDVAAVLPSMERLCRVELSGKVLREAFEWSVATYEYGAGNFQGSFLQVSGIKVKYEVSKSIGSRVASLEARCSNCLVPHFTHVKDTHNYSLLTTHYLANGGDGFDMLKFKSHAKQELDEIGTDVVMDYIKRKSPIYPGVEERIIVTDSARICLPMFLSYLFLIHFNFLIKIL